ncbi:hypothetical protein [Streptomyces sp. NBC_01190]|uniref:hypothetical protein n=1 Tax=Streptomyces sp. NBC_01190 TaxID=2903767 RepID=UPI003869FD92|nr:hypothetical protein OG519_18060 [Streptomyces sp. NBC_01190]
MAPAPAAAIAHADPPDPGDGSFGVRLVDVPAALVNDPRARHYVIDNLTPGTGVRRRVEVVNSSDATLRVDVYPAAARISHGSFTGAAGATPNELSSWTRPNRRTLDIPAHGSARDTVTITVPRDAAPGERYAVIWAQVTGQRSSGISLVSRSGIRMYLSVGGHNPPASNFTAHTMTAERGPGGLRLVHARITNTGGRALDLSGALTLSSARGSLHAGPYAVELGTSLAPGQSEPVTAPVTDEVIDGPWHATLELRSGLLDKKIRATITFPPQRGITTAAVTASNSPDTLELGMLAAGVTLIAGSTALIATTRRRRRQEPR